MKLIPVAGGNAEGIKRWTRAKRGGCLEGWFDE